MTPATEVLSQAQRTENECLDTGSQGPAVKPESRSAEPRFSKPSSLNDLLPSDDYGDDRLSYSRMGINWDDPDLHAVLATP